MRSVYLIILDTVRKDYFREYAPRLQDMSDINIDKAYATSSWSVPSHASMFTGLLPYKHGINTHSRNFDLPKEDLFIDNLGVKSFGVSSNVYASESFGFDKYFDNFWSISRQNRLPDGINIQEWLQDNEKESYHRYIDLVREIYRHDNSIDSLLNAIYLKADDKLADSRLVEKPIDDGTKAVLNQATKAIVDEPQFGFINIMEAHSSVNPTRMYNSNLYNAPKSWSSFNFDDWGIILSDSLSKSQEQNIKIQRELYSAAIDYIDRELSTWIENHRDGNSTFIITADHGENLYHSEDNNLLNHSGSLNESLINVPLCIIDPPENQEINDELVTHLDMGKLVQSLVNNSMNIPTRNIIPTEVIGNGIGEPDNIDEWDSKFWDRSIRACIRNRTKIIWDSLGNIKRINLQTNNEEQIENVPDWAINEFQTDIEQSKQDAVKNKKSTGLDSSVEDRLEDLGYK